MADFPGQWPIPKFHFRVTIDGAQISFQEVSGLDQEVEPIEYRHGDSESFIKMKQAGLVKTTNLVCKKGVFSTDDRISEIFKKVYEKEYYTKEDGRMEILVELLDELGETVMSWSFVNAIPVKLTGTDLKSDGNEVAIESIEFVHEGITVEIA